MSTYGTGIGNEGGLDPTFAIQDEVTSVAVEMCRRLTTPAGSLFWAPNDGLDVRAYLNSDLEPEDVESLRGAIVHEARKDERLATVVVTADFDEVAGVLTLTLTGTLSTGAPFRIVIAATALSVDLLDAA